MLANNVYFCPTLHVFKDYIERTEVYRETEQEKFKKVFTVLYNVSKYLTYEMARRGVKMLVGQDGWNPTFTFKEMELLQEIGLSERDILLGATLYPAEWLGVNDKYGAIEEGKKANFLILNENPLKNIQALSTVFSVVKDGKIILEE